MMKNIPFLLTLSSVLILSSCGDDPTPPTLSVSADAAYVSSETLSVGLSASVSPKEAEISECGFYYGEDAKLAEHSKVTASKRGDGTFSASRIFQDFGKTYYYQAYIIVENGSEVASAIKSFKTLEFEEYVELQAPQISFDYGTCIATTSTHLSLATGISLTDRGICYGEDENPEQEGKGKTVSAGAGNSDFTALTGQLQKAKTYYVRSFVRQGDCTAYSDVVSFRTDAAFKALKIIPASGWVLAPGAALEFKVFRIGSDDTELDVTSSATWEYSVGTLSQNPEVPSRFTGCTEGTAYVKATYKDVASDRTESVQSDGEVTGQSTVEYTEPQVSVEVTRDIPATGGSIRSRDCKVTYSQIKITHYSGGHEYRDTITSGGEETFTPEEISAPSLGTTVKERSKVGSFTVTVTMNGKSGESDPVDVYQQENKIEGTTFDVPQVSLDVTKDIPAGGGSVTAEYCDVSYSQKKTCRFTSTETTVETVTSGGQTTYSDVSAPSLGTTLKERSKVGSVTATVSMNGKSGKSKPADIYQQANEITGAEFLLPTDILILNETTEATATIAFTSGSAALPGDDGITFESQDETVVSCTPDGLITGRSSTTSATDTDNLSGRSTNIVLSYCGIQTNASRKVTVCPKLIELNTDDCPTYCTVNQWEPFSLGLTHQNIYDNTLLTPRTTYSYEIMSQNIGHFITSDCYGLEFDFVNHKMRANGAGVTYVTFEFIHHLGYPTTIKSEEITITASY